MPHAHAFFMHKYHFFFSILLILIYAWYFSASFFLSFSLSLFLSLFIRLVCSMAPKKSKSNPFGTFFISRHLLLIQPPLTFGFVMRKLVRTSRRTFLDEAFIRNVRSSYRIFPILSFPLSSIAEVGSPFMASRSLVPL